MNAVNINQEFTHDDDDVILLALNMEVGPKPKNTAAGLLMKMIHFKRKTEHFVSLLPRRRGRAPAV